jgi:DNA primase
VARDVVELKKQVKAANDIVDVVAGYTPVAPAGKIFKALCPFHNDSKPSMQLDRSYQNYHCWACGAKGDVFDIVEKYEKVGFKEAMAILARRAGIKLDGDSPADQHKVQLFEVMAWAAHTYQTCYREDEAAAVARKYVGERRLSGPTTQKFGIGYAPLDGSWLVQRAAADKVPTDILVEVGLLAERDEGRGFYDRFRDRVMFPIRDMQGRTVGFGGRILPTSPYAVRGPKYYNSAETPLFKKSDCLYGLDHARHDGAKAGFLAVVEGYTDVMAAHQAGVTHVVATMGTALNAAHVAQLRRYVPKVVLVFDADDGGTTGVDRALEIFVSHDAELAVATLPDGLDPADLFGQPNGTETFRSALANAKDALDFKLDSLLVKEKGGGVDAARRMIDAVLGVIALAPAVPGQSAAVKQDLILTRLAHRLGVRLEVVRTRLKELQTERRRQAVREAERAKPVPMASAARVTTPPGPKPPTSQRAALEKQLLQLCLAEPNFVPQAMTAVPADTIEHTGIRRILTELYALASAGDPADMDGLRVRLIDRPDLATAALDNQHIGRGVADRPAYFAKVLAGFAKMLAEAAARAVKEQLSATDDAAAAIDRLRALQDLTRPKKPPTGTA